MSRFSILLGGDLARTSRLDAQFAGTRVIAANSGIRHAALLGIIPELWMGDFDSVPDGLPPALASVRRKTYSPDKDKSDGELAISEALNLGASSLLLAGAFGGSRADHALLHLAMAVRRAKENIEVVLTSGYQEGTPLLPGTRKYDYAKGTLFSIIGFSHLTGLTVSGAKWPLDNVEVPFGSSLTVSNEVAGELRISLLVGRAVVIAHAGPASGRGS